MMMRTSSSSAGTNTSFGKLYVTPFPSRGIMVWDDCMDRAALYDSQIVDLVALNQSEGVQAKKHLRRQLRVMVGKTVQFPFWQMESKKVKDGMSEDKDGNKTQKYKNVNVRIDYTQGVLRIGQTAGKNTMELNGDLRTEFDLSSGFDCTVSFSDGYGSTNEGEGGSWNNQATSLGHGGLGISNEFVMGVQGNKNRDDIDGSPGIDNLIGENEGLWNHENQIETLLEMHQRYRDDRQQRMAKREEILSAKFW